MKVTEEGECVCMCLVRVGGGEGGGITIIIMITSYQHCDQSSYRVNICLAMDTKCVILDEPDPGPL